MKLNELKQVYGTYAALRVLSPSIKVFLEFLKDNQVPLVNSSKERRLHVTLLYSRKPLPRFVADPELEHSASFKSWDLFDTTSSTAASDKCLVMKLTAPTLVKRFDDLMDKHQATYDYPSYVPHITVSYGVPLDFDITALPAFPHKLVLGDEYREDLDD